jgi:hypothetical protein
VKESTKEKIDLMNVHELEADVKNAQTSPFQGTEKRRYIDERLSYLKSTAYSKADLLDAKPNFFGFGVNLNEAWRRFRNWWIK